MTEPAPLQVDQERLIKLTDVLRGISQEEYFAPAVAAALVASGWSGSRQELVACMPKTDSFDSEALTMLFLSLGYRLVLRDATTQVCRWPALLQEGDRWSTVLAWDGELATVYDQDGLHQCALPVEGMFLEIHPLQNQQPVAHNWFGGQLNRHAGLAVTMVLLSLIYGISALAVPLFVRHIYDMVIPTRSVDALAHLGFGVVLALLAGGFVSYLNIRIAGKIGRQTSLAMVRAYLRKQCFSMLDSPAAGLLKKPYQRIREFVRLQTSLFGQNGLALMDIPFLIIFFIVTFLLGKWIVIVPLLSLCVYLFVIPLFGRAIRQFNARWANLSAEKRAFDEELRTRRQDITESGLAPSWLARYEDVSRAVVMHRHQAACLTSVNTNVVYWMGLFSNLATMAVGIYLVMNQVMTTGDLIASMMIVRRILAPLQAATSAVGKIGESRSTMLLMDRLLAAPDSKESGCPIPVVAPGSLLADNLFYRYPGQAQYALQGVSFEAAPGDTVAVSGPNNGGKSTLIHLMGGLLRPTSGKAQMDGWQIEHLNTYDYGNSVALATPLPSEGEVTIGELFNRIHPELGEDDVFDVLQKVGLMDIVGEGCSLDAPLRDLVKLEKGSLALKLLSLALACAGGSPVILIDIPFSHAQGLEKEYFVRFLEAYADRTIIFSTLQPDIMLLADNALVLNEGKVAYFGPAQQDEQSKESDEAITL